MSFLLPVLLGIIGAAILLCLLRMVGGPTPADRAVAVDTTATVTAALLVLLGFAFKRYVYLDVALVYAVLTPGRGPLVATAGAVVTTIGTLFLFLGSLGVLRFPDVYNRLQGGTKCTTLGAFLTVIGVGIMAPGWFVKALLIALFILLTNPISSHALGRAGRKSGVPLWKGSVVDRSGSLESPGGEGP